MEYLVFDSNVSQRWHRVKEFINYSRSENNFWDNIKKHTRFLLKGFMELSMEEELITYTNASKYQRTDNRLDYRNGFYCRNLDTELGPIDSLRVPRSRLGLFRTKLFEFYQRRQKAVNQAITNVFLAGISTRDTSNALKPVLETSFSASCVSRIIKGLNEHVEKFHTKEIIDQYQFLFLDGITLSVKGSLNAAKKLILVAYGITIFGERQLISFRISPSESQASWETFLNDLYNRGLKGHNLKLITTDGCKGLHAALDIVYAYIKRQHCWVHKLRNASKYLRKNDEKQVLSEAKQIYQADTKREAIKLFKSWKQHWVSLYPKAINCIEKDLDTLLAFLEIPLPEKNKQSIRKKIRTTNVIERSFREVRRRTRPMSCFNNQESVNRIIYANFSKFNNKWKLAPLKQFTQLN